MKREKCPKLRFIDVHSGIFSLEDMHFQDLQRRIGLAETKLEKAESLAMSRRSNKKGFEEEDPTMEEEEESNQMEHQHSFLCDKNEMLGSQNSSICHSGIRVGDSTPEIPVSYKVILLGSACVGKSSLLSVCAQGNKGYVVGFQILLKN